MVKINGNRFLATQLSKFTLATKLCCVLAVLSCLVYANTINNDYVMDDVMMITENHYVQQGISGIPALLTTHHLEGFGANKVSDYYRPLSLVMFAVEYQFFGLNPSEGHFLNIIFFAAGVVLMFLFLNRLFNGEKLVVAFVASLLFAVHPLHTEVVSNIKGRDELLCFFFAFISLHLFINYCRQGKWYQLLAGTLLLSLSVLSKETAVTFIGIIPLVFFFYKNDNKKRGALITVCTIAVVFLFLVMWNYVQTRNQLQESVVTKIFHSHPAGVPGHGLSGPYLLILGYHLRLMFVPWPLNSNYSFRDFVFNRYETMGILLSATAYLLLIFTGLRRLIKNKKDPWAFGILFYLVTLSLYSNVIPLGQALANRYAFFPSVGFCFVLALAFEKWILRTEVNDFALLKGRKPLMALIPVLLCYSVMTIARNTDWKDNFSIVKADLPKSQDDYGMLYKAGLELQVKYNKETDTAMKRQLNEKSIEYFLRSLELNPDYTEAHSDIGTAYFQKDQFDSAEFHFKRVLELNPAHYNAGFNLAMLFYKKQQFRDAITYYQKTIRIDSAYDITVWYNMGVCYARTKQYDSSVWSMKKVIAVAPQLDNYKSFGNVAIMYKMMGQMDSARKYEQLTKQYYPAFNL
jgi:tetratricopeptide (TPR) repeat protein